MRPFNVLLMILQAQQQQKQQQQQLDGIQQKPFGRNKVKKLGQMLLVLIINVNAR